MDRSEAAARVRVEMARVLNRDPSELGDDVHIYRDLKADSLDVIEILMPVEEWFEVDAGQTTLDRVETVGEFIDHVMAARPAPILPLP